MRRTSVITYARVSTKAQGDKGVSLDDQQAKNNKFLDPHNMQSFGDFSDVGSGLKEEEGSKRENYLKLCRISLKNDWPVVVNVPSRFTRTPAELDRYFAKGGRLICTELGINATNDEIRSFLLAEIVQHEQRQRTAAIGQQRSRADGKLPGNPNLALAREKSLQVRQENALLGYAEFERQLEIAYAEGATTPKAIATAFHKAGFKTPQNCRWKEGNVRRVIEAIAKLKAASGALSAANQPYDNVKPPTPAIMIYDAPLEKTALPIGVATQDVYPLSPDELAEFREHLDQSSATPEKIDRLYQKASSPLLTQKDRASIINWIGKKRGLAGDWMVASSAQYSTPAC